ncbi:vWA domain-containing protein [Halioxenophilus sp. WMMB6]|uniref:vWA domain-containing protein n=1 Tax=Halioxenophilus sp. WMMB6 TaxID=3073815 RepID=UPI00295E2464|nr:vWA domain-containing protein [Halioxenophilus sp. WMMB6]
MSVTPFTQAQPAAADVRLVVDISGSMKLNDPNNLRQPAVELLVQLLPEGSKAGVWTFGQYVNMLIPHRPVDDQWLASAKEKSSEINSVGLFTNIGEALEKATYDRARPDSNYQTSLILLTDGMVDIDRDPEANQAEWRRIIDEVVPKLVEAGVRVHTIALSDKADTQLLNKIALATGGKAAVAKTADELMKAFLAAFDQAAPGEQVPLSGDSFVIDSSVEEFTALIFRKTVAAPTVLVGPDLTRYSATSVQADPDVNWHSGDDYDLITLKRPLEGEWFVETGIAPDSRVTVVSNLNLLVKPMPINLFRGQALPVDVRLQEDGKTITDHDFLRLLTLNVDTKQGEQTWQDDLTDTPEEGVYRTRLAHFDELGDFQVTIALDGKSFQRQFRHSVSVRDAFAVDFQAGPQPGMPYELHVIPYMQSVDLAQSSVIARITSPSGQTAILPVPLTQVDDWLLKYSPAEEGEYQISLAIDVVETSGNRYQYQHPVINFRYPEGSEPEAVSEPVPEPAPVAQPEELPPAPAPAKASGTPWWVYLLLGLGNLMIFGLAFAAYKLIMGTPKEVEAEPEPVAKAKTSKEEAPTADKPGVSSGSLAMADIVDDDLEDAFTDATDLSSDDALGLELEMDSGQGSMPDAPMDDLDAMLAEATADLASIEDDDDDGEFTLDDFGVDDDDNDKKS